MRVNSRIRASQVRVIGAQGEQLGIMASKEAYMTAQKEGYDLVEVAPDAKPPVCKFLDYGKFQYQQKKRAHKPGAATHRTKMKEVRLTPQIDPHDLSIKLKKVRELLEKGDKVTISVRFRGRQMRHREIGTELMKTIIEEMGDEAKVDRHPSFEGRRLSMVFAPISTK